MAEEKGNKVLTYILVAPFVIPLVVVFAFYNAWAAVKVWGWFLAEPLHYQLTYPVAIGVYLLVGLARGYRQRSDKEAQYAIVYEVFQPAMVVGVAWAIRAVGGGQ